MLISGSDAVHIAKVLRLQPGTRILLFDGRGREHEALIRDTGNEGVRVEVLASRCGSADPPLRLAVALGYLKENKMDRLVRQLTELGATALLLFPADRCVSRPEGRRLSVRCQRWEKIALETLKSCRRGQPPEIRTAGSLTEALALGRDYGLKLLFWEETPGPFALDPESQALAADGVFLLLGPEGGLQPEEVEAARDQGFRLAGLGPRILRAETATVAALTLVQHICGDMGQKELDKPARFS